MISMLPLKISRFLEPAPLSQSQVGQARPRLAAAEAPALAPVEALTPEYDRRVTANRRMQDRRSAEQSTFLDTRSSQGRRRTPGRRAGDQTLPARPKAISVMA